MSRNVVIVEDNESVARMLGSIVKRSGFAPLTFESPPEACDALANMTEPPDAAFVDLVFSHRQCGLDVVQALWRRFSHTVPITIVTGWSHEHRQAMIFGLRRSAVL